MGLLEMIGGRRIQGGGGISPITLGLLGLLAYRTLNGKGRLADMLGTHVAPQPGVPGVPGASGMGTASTSPAGTAASSPGGTSGPGGLGALGGLLGGGALGSGLRDLLDRFRGTPHENAAQSWVSTGANQPIAPHELEQALGAERLQWLMQQTGLPKDQLLAGLSSELPAAVDKLTPEGRVPTDEELKHMA